MTTRKSRAPAVAYVKAELKKAEKRVRKLKAALPKAKEKRRRLDSSEIATILAALRYWQKNMDGNEAAFDSGSHFEETAPLDAEAIDALCEAINCGQPQVLV